MLEIDEYAHVDKKLEYKKSRQLMVEKTTGHTFLRFNSVTVDFTNCKVMNQVSMHMKLKATRINQNVHKKVIDWWSFKKFITSGNRIKIKL